jgi:thermitase
MTQGPRRRLAFLSLIAAGASALAFGIPLVQNSGARNDPLPQRAFTPVAIEAPDSSVPGQVLVGLRPGVSPAHLRLLEQAAGGKDLRRVGPAIRLSGRQIAAQVQAVTPYVLKVSSRVDSAIGQLRRSRVVAYAEPNYVMHADAVPNDPSFSLQWGSNNTGQSIPTQNAEEELGAPAPGTPAADDNALKAWSVSTGSRSIVIGETDTGINYNHADLAANIWSNPGGIGGCAAGTHGYNVLTATCEPMDDDSYYGGHGTHVAGIMGAVGNNGIGVAGMNWQSTILPVKWLGSSATGSTSGLIAALQWIVAAKQAGVNIHVVNDSATFWGTAYSQALAEEIETLGANNILFVTAAGNTGNNNDELAVRRYPCGYDLANEICVAASNDNDQLPSWANYGPHTVDLAAPGVSIYSTLRNGGYGYLSGGSMASPQVAGAAALILSVEPTLSATALKADIVENVDKLSSLTGRVISGGRLDVCNALPGCEGRVSHPASTFGTTTVGALRDGGMFSNYKIVHAATLTTAGSVTKLSLYAVPGAASPSTQSLKAVIYSDSGGSPGALVATGTEVTYNGAVNGSGWFELPFATPVALTPGAYWLGFITGSNTEGLGYAYETVAGGRAYNANSYASGPTNSFGAASKDGEQASIFATYMPSAPGNPPVNTTLPTISGTAQTGQTLNASSGTWSESPSSYVYQWQRCNSSGASCTAISAATAQSYTVASADVGSTLRVTATASNSAGASAPAISTQTALIQQGAATFGKTTVGSSGDSYAANRKRVNRYALPVNGTVSKLSIYLAPTGVSGQQVLKGVIYADASGAPGALLDVSEQLTFKSTNAAGWYDLTLPAPLKLTAGNYWIGAITGTTSSVAGFRYSSVSGSRDYNTDTYTTGATSAFGAASVDSEQTSLYATYTPG